MEIISKMFNFSPRKSAEVKFSINKFKNTIDRDGQFQGWLKKKKKEAHKIFFQTSSLETFTNHALV